jgi:hypothetical protein
MHVFIMCDVIFVLIDLIVHLFTMCVLALNGCSNVQDYVVIL